MLKLSNNSIEKLVDKTKYRSFEMMKDYSALRTFNIIIVSIFFLLIIISFLPWTQNVRGKGYITTLTPDQRPQNINSIIAGRIEKWYVKEGDFVNKGDTLLFISEVKDEYFNPNLVENQEQQIANKEQSVDSYDKKAKALNSQISALNEIKKLKLEQAGNYLKQSQLKVQSDSINLSAAGTDYDIAVRQANRTDILYKQGLKSLTALEDKKQKVQSTLAKKISSENKLLASRNQLINARVELSSVTSQYDDKLAKARSDRFSSLSNKYNADASVTKMRNKLSSISVRQGYYYITAPQDGYITKTIFAGIGETLKEGAKLMTIMPSHTNLATEIYIRPIDLPLVAKGQDVRLVFDGWPAIAFSGWPGMSTGTYGGRVFAVDRYISDNGKYRVLVSQTDQEPWPEALRVGSGANAMALLKDVPIWYEMWRRINGFPPDYYQGRGEKIDINKPKVKIKIK